MATLPIYDTVPDVRGYASTRVFSGVRKLSDAAAKAHRARVQRALQKRAEAKG